MAVLAGIVLSSAALAQGGSPSGSPSAKQQAPVGHKQPRPVDVPSSGGTTTTSSDEAMKQMDRELDRTLKSICRGC